MKGGRDLCSRRLANSLCNSEQGSVAATRGSFRIQVAVGAGNGSQSLPHEVQGRRLGKNKRGNSRGRAEKDNL